MERTSGKYTKQRKIGLKNLLVLILASVFVILVVVAFLLPGSSPENPAGSDGSPTSPNHAEDMVIHSIQEQGQTILVTTSYGTVRYPFAFSDIISVEAVTEEDRAALVFTANINDNFEPIFTLWFNGDTGIICGFMEMKEGTCPVRVEFMPVPEDLHADYLLTFYAAQESVNEVLSSLNENANYTESDGG